MLYGGSVGIVNPIKRVRRDHHKTLEEFSEEIGVHLQALYLNERGVYTTILPKVMYHLTELGESFKELTEQYARYQHEARIAIGEFYRLGEYVPDTLGEPMTDEGHPFVIFRELHLVPGPVSRMAFAKNFCVHPAQLYSLENGRTPHMPEQLCVALRIAGLPDMVIRELNNRIEEYVSGGFAHAEVV